MKRIFNLFAFAAIAALTLAGCSKNDQNAPEKEAEQMHITVKANVQNIKADPGTKTYIDTYNGTPNTILWGENEYMTIMVQSGSSSNFATSNSDNASLFDGEPEAIFEFSITPETSDSYIYGGVYPASCSINWNAQKPYDNNNDAEEFKVSLPPTQNATASSYDPAAYIMVARPTPFTEPQTEWDASYRRATALNKITLTGISEDIVSVEFTAPEGTYMAGRRHINLTTGESGSLYGDTRTETITVNANLTGTSKVVWFTSWETLIPEGSKFKIVAKSATKSYTRELTAKSAGINFKEGYLNTLNVNMSSAQVEDLVNYSGNYLILANNSGWQIMSTMNSYHYFEHYATGITKDNVSFDDFSNITDINDYIWTVSKIDGGYSFKNYGTNKYLALTSDGNNAYYSDDPEAFDLSIADNGGAVIKSKTYTERVLRYNAGSPRFAFYNGTQQPVYMIDAVIDTREKVATPTFSPAEGAVDINTVVTISCSTSGATIYYTTDGTEPTTASSSGSSVTIDAEKTIKALAVKDGYKNSDIATASYIIAGVPQSLPYTESFASNVGLFTIDNVVYDGTAIWTHSSNSGNYFMKATGYYSKENHAVESWLVSPLIQIPSLSTGETVLLKFSQCINKYFGTIADEATLWVKTTGGDWTEVNITYPSISSGSYSSFEEQEVNLSSYQGQNIQFAFKYEGTATAAGTWEIMNVSVRKYEPVTLSSITVSGQTTDFVQNGTFSFDGTVTATYSDATTADVTSSADISVPDLSTTGEKTVTVSYTEGGVTKTTEYSITVSSGGSGTSWTRVTNVATLLAGGTFIIGYEKDANTGIIIPMANSGSATTSAAGFIYSGSTASSGGTGTIDMSSVVSTTNFEVTIVASTTVSGAICIKLGENYLGNTNTKNNCKLFIEESKTTSFTPTVGDNDVFTLTISDNATYHTLQYNTVNPRFAVYGGGQKNVVIYKKN